MHNPIERYADYYGDENLRLWRELSAKDKAANIMNLWTAIDRRWTPRVVDIGCGDGAVARELARNGFGRTYVGFEISSSALAAARRQNDMNLQFLLFDGFHLPVPKGAFDLAILSHVLEHAESPRHLLKEVARVAEYVFVEVPLELNWRTRPDFNFTDTGHINLYNSLILRHTVQSTGLHVLAERITCPGRKAFAFIYPGWQGHLRSATKAALLKVAPAIACRLLTYHGCLIARSP